MDRLKVLGEGTGGCQDDLVSLHLLSMFTGQGDIPELMTINTHYGRNTELLQYLEHPVLGQLEDQLQRISIQNAVPQPGPQSVAPFNLGPTKHSEHPASRHTSSCSRFYLDFKLIEMFLSLTAVLLIHL